MERPYIISNHLPGLIDYYCNKYQWNLQFGLDRDKIRDAIKDCAKQIHIWPSAEKGLVQSATVTMYGLEDSSKQSITLSEHFHIEQVENELNSNTIEIGPNTDLIISLIKFRLGSQLEDDFKVYSGILLTYRDKCSGLEFSKTIIAHRDTIDKIDNLFPKCSECGTPLYNDDVDELCQECREHYSDEHLEEYTEE